MYKTFFIPKKQLEALGKELEHKLELSQVAGLYWLNMPEDLLNAMQKEHFSSCGPYLISIEIEGDKLIIEYLLRARKTLHCDCIHKTSEEQKQYVNNHIDEILLNLKISPLKTLEHE